MPLIDRTIEPVLRTLAGQYPVVTITGPRQSGKTTLCRTVFAHKPYANLESPDIRQFAIEDPRGFLAQYPEGAILDEIQRTPDLVSYLQPIVDASHKRTRNPFQMLVNIFVYLRHSGAIVDIPDDGQRGD